jgi:CheY-like chemotaxis protein
MEPTTVQLDSPLKILLVDDSRAIQAIIKRAISHCGYAPIEVFTASDGEQGIQATHDHDPDLIITDWHMPKITGLEMLQSIRQRGHRNVRVGFVTTERTPSMLNEAMVNGAAFILNKPFDDAELVSTVRDNVQGVVTARQVVLNAQNLTEPAAKAPAPAKQSGPSATHDPVPMADLQMALARKLGNLPFRIIPNEKISADRLTPNNLLGLYVATERKGVYGIGVMDANAVCIVGGGSSRKTPLEVRSAMTSGEPDKLMLAKAQEFLNHMAQTLTKTALKDAGAVTLANSSIVKNTFGKLTEVVEQVGHRSDVRISIPGYGEGRMAFFLLGA